MFLEPYLNQRSPMGWIELICGCMFSGKTEELLRRIRRVEIAGQTFKVFKPKIDIRYAQAEVVSHDQTSAHAIPVKSPNDILTLGSSCRVIGIDEAQFFDPTLLHIIEQLTEKNVRIIISGLDMDYEGKPFGIMPQLMAIADFVTKVKAICAVCGTPASFSYRLDTSEDQVLLGEKDKYEPRCRSCFRHGMKERNIHKK